MLGKHFTNSWADQTLCCKVNRERPSNWSKEFQSERFILHTCLQQQEWNRILWPMISGFSVSSLYSGQKKKKKNWFNRHRTKYQRAKLHICWLQFCLHFSSSFDILFSCTQQVYLKQSRFQWILPRDLTLSIFTASHSKSLRGLVTLPGNKLKQS